MRRLLMVMLFALLTLSALPMTSFAQDQKLGWDLQSDTHVDVTDLGFRFYYPKGWVLDTKKGITLGQTQADIDAANDGDDSTQAAGMTIGISGFPIAGLTDLGDDPSLDDIVDFAVKANKIIELSRTEAPVMTRRSLSVIGTNKAARAGFATFWKQGEYAVIVTLGLPDTVSVDEMGYTWGVTLASIAPLDAQPLGDGMLTADESHFTVSYPDGWTLDPQNPRTVYEHADEVGTNIQAITGGVFNMIDNTLSKLGLKDDATLDDLVAVVATAVTLGDNPKQEEFLLLGQPAVTVSGELAKNSPGEGRGVIFTVAIVDGHGIILSLVTPSPEAITDYMPTWIQMLRSLTPIKAAE
ncbi:MAG: hypothetical protein ABI690_14730 [Chloroflexota bacterium]